MKKSMTMTQKILAHHCNKAYVQPGEFIEVNLDIVLGNDITAPVGIEVFEKMGHRKVFDKEKIALVPDHFTPNKDIKAAEQCKALRNFALKHEIKHYFEIGEMGIEHALLPEKGIVLPGQVVIGADSHTCTYGALGAFSTGVGSTDMGVAMATGQCWFKVPKAICFEMTGSLKPYVSGKDVILHIIGMIGVDGARYKSMEFMGEGIKNLSIDDRFTIANMAIEAGAKNGIFITDKITEDYLKDRALKPYKTYAPDEGANYEKVYHIDLSTIKSTVAKPHLPENTVTIDAIEKIEIDQVVIGSCTNGRISDMKAVAEILKGRKIKKGLRVIIFPATQNIYLECIEKGYIKTFIEAGAIVSTPTCGPCLGGHMGILAEGEKALATTNRNFIGRMGHKLSEIYLASPQVAAASAVLGYIASPMDLKHEV